MTTAESSAAPFEAEVPDPASRPGVVPRVRLPALQAAAASSRLVLVSAPAGYGKSTLVAQWLEHDVRAGCWLQLDHRDNDPVILLGRMAAALGLSQAIGGALSEELAQPVPRIQNGVLPLLAGHLADRDPFVVVLDDVDVITAQRGRAILAFLVAHVPPGSQLILITRGDPPVPVARLRASGDLAEIGVHALALDAEETRDLAASGGLKLSDDAAHALCERTEGWAAAVVLATLSLRGLDDAEARAAALSGDQTQIADYLLEEVLERQPEHLRDFLLATSVLERMTAPLCDAVLGTTSAAASLEALARSNAFVLPIDAGRRWFRYHRLFGDLLRAELRRRHPELLCSFLRRAADWCELYGTPGEAFIYAHESGDLAQAGRIALAHREELSRRGQSESVRLWLERCSDEEIESDPQLAVACAWTSLFGRDLPRARRAIAAAERLPLDGPSADGAPSLRSSLASVRSLLATDGISQMLRDGELIYASEKEGGTWLASGCRAKGIAHVLLGLPEEGLAELREGLALLSDHPEFVHFRVVNLGYLAFAAEELGHGRDLQRWAVAAAQTVADAHLEETVGGAIAATAAALAQQQRGDTGEAARQLDAFRQRRQYLPGVTWLEADLALRCAAVTLDLGDPAGALELAEVADDALQGYPDPGVLPVRLASIEARVRSGETYGLTSAELRVVALLPTHLSLQEIADRLYLARSTVKTHVASIYDKLGVPGRSEAVELVARFGFVPDAQSIPEIRPSGG